MSQKVVTTTELRANIYQLFNDIASTGKPLLVRRQNEMLEIRLAVKRTKTHKKQ